MTSTRWLENEIQEYDIISKMCLINVHKLKITVIPISSQKRIALIFTRLYPLSNFHTVYHDDVIVQSSYRKNAYNTEWLHIASLKLYSFSFTKIHSINVEWIK
jgi:hypothetical protein